MNHPTTADAVVSIERLTAENGEPYTLLTVRHRTLPPMLHLTTDPDTGEAVALDAESGTELARHESEPQLVLMLLAPVLEA